MNKYVTDIRAKKIPTYRGNLAITSIRILTLTYFYQVYKPSLSSIMPSAINRSRKNSMTLTL